MEIDYAADPGAVEPGILAYAVFDPVVDPPLAPEVRELVAPEEIRGDSGQTVVVHTGPGRRVVLAGAGRRADADADSLRDAAAAVARLRAAAEIAWVLDDTLPLTPAEQARAVVDGLVLGGYDPGKWKTTGERRALPERLVLVGGDEAAAAAARRAERVAAAANRARDLSNRPPNDLTPARLADRAAELAGAHATVTSEALGPDEIEALGMGAFAAVGRASRQPPRLIVLRHEPPDPVDGIVLGLVGKAITFDTGGISLKSRDGMEDMKGDMSGGGAVIEGLGVIAELGIPVRTLAVVAAAENAIGGDAFRPGDILTAMNGTTIEVVDTDAEGRLVLADALWYARMHGATHLVDFATLTGAIERALGDLYSGVMGNDDAWRDRVVAAGNASGDHAWPLPLHRRYRRLIDSSFADVKNLSARALAVPLYAASFLEEFVGEGPWAHIDLAGPAFLRVSRGDYLSQQGGTGYGVRLIAELAEGLAR
jgi:leucyl aminopeptidase